MKIVGWHSTILIVALVFAILFSYLYSSFQSNYGISHDPNSIPTKPKLSEAQAIDIVEREYRKRVPDYQEAYLHFHYYNYSRQLDMEGNQDYQQYLRSLGAGWSFSHIKEKPELLGLPLIFVHANGTVYLIGTIANPFEKICYAPSVECPALGVRGGEAAKDRLVYEVGAIAVGNTGFNQDVHYIIDAETGTIVFHTPYIEQKPVLPRTVLDNNHTIQELRQIIENTNEGIAVQIVQNASEIAIESGDSIRKGYDPPDVLKTLSNATRIVWFNNDDTSHTVTSDNDYVDRLGNRFDSGVIESGKYFEFVFTDSGYFTYHCEIHPWMKGRVAILEDFT